jgi:GT2 family glycosyltransferase
VIARLSWCHPADVRVSISDSWIRTQATSVPDRYRKGEANGSVVGFIAVVEGAGAGRWLPQQRFRVELHSGAHFELVAPPSPIEPVLARDAVLRTVSDEEFSAKSVGRLVAPVVAALHRRHLAGDRVQREVVVGEMPSKPSVSVIVPIYKVVEFLRYQFASFAVDSDFKDTELVLVVDSPEQGDEIEGRVRALHGLYGVPARIVIHQRNLGYAPAINTGVSHSIAKMLVLMNSDVVPYQSGWMQKLWARLSKCRGVVGPKLLFHDDSIQHAGMSFGRDLRGEYFNYHDYKGYPRNYPPASIARKVQALTGACLMLPRELYLAVGGVSEDYVVGDFEDSDFCLRIQSLGMELWYEPDAELYHYERQSISHNDSYTGTRACGYNRWLHTNRWHSELNHLVRKPSSRGLGSGFGPSGYRDAGS